MWKCKSTQELFPHNTKNRKKTTPKPTEPIQHRSGQRIQPSKTIWYWPTMKAEIQQMVDNCYTCQIHQRQKTRCNPIPESTIADLLPHQQLNMDYGHYNGKNYLIIADRATGYIFAHKTENYAQKPYSTYLKTS